MTWGERSSGYTPLKLAALHRLSPHRKHVDGLGHPLYVNGHLYQEPVTISHVPGPVGAIDPSMGALGSYVAYAPQLPPLGAEDLPGATKASLPPGASAPSPIPGLILGVLDTAAVVASIYHGYKRNDSIGWAVWWGVMGGLFPIVTVPVALAQGFGKKKGMTPNRRRGRRRRNRRRR